VGGAARGATRQGHPHSPSGVAPFGAGNHRMDEAPHPGVVGLVVGMGPRTHASSGSTTQSIGPFVPECRAGTRANAGYGAPALPVGWGDVHRGVKGIMSKRIRLPLDTYALPGSTWLVTTVVRDRMSRPFSNYQLASEVLQCFVNDAPSRGAVLHLGVVLPDHAHLIAEIASGHLVDLMRDLKTHTTRLWWGRGGNGALWQKSFHDRGLRTPDGFRESVRYVLDNPVRLGLVERWEDYPHIGGAIVGDE
jgi:putative transposase